MVNQDLSDTKENNKVVKTQLDAVVRYIHEYYETQDVKEVKKPWLPPLPEQLVSPQELIRATPKELNMKIAMGLIDIPEKQEQEFAVYCFSRIWENRLFDNCGFVLGYAE